MKAKKSKDNRAAYLAIGILAIVVIAIIFSSSEKGNADSFTPSTIKSDIRTVQPTSMTQSGNLRIENIEGDKLKVFNGENVVIKSSDISFFINNAAIRCAGIKDLEPKKSAECTLEARCQKGDALKISYSGKGIEYNC